MSKFFKIVVFCMVIVLVICIGIYFGLSDENENNILTQKINKQAIPEQYIGEWTLRDYYIYNGKIRDEDSIYTISKYKILFNGKKTKESYDVIDGNKLFITDENGDSYYFLVRGDYLCYSEDDKFDYEDDIVRYVKSGTENDEEDKVSKYMTQIIENIVYCAENWSNDYEEFDKIQDLYFSVSDNIMEKAGIYIQEYSCLVGHKITVKIEKGTNKIIEVSGSADMRFDLVGDPVNEAVYLIRSAIYILDQYNDNDFIVNVSNLSINEITNFDEELVEDNRDKADALLCSMELANSSEIKTKNGTLSYEETNNEIKWKYVTND